MFVSRLAPGQPAAFTTPRNARSRYRRIDGFFSTSQDRPCRLPIRRRPCRITRARKACGFVAWDSAVAAAAAAVASPSRPLSALDLGTDLEVLADEGVGYHGMKEYEDWVQPLSVDP